ncbi:uncharacterized protein LOC129323092 [Prosopis cineraria]|uniref:uncharacterized protein LOC129323092 n=1 Tax=Prosopis cineraria TaxID=364024 RepID=UPI00240FB5A9|nr:uncharacterized protein LOC129323092 [Prosopis cineraria]
MGVGQTFDDAIVFRKALYKYSLAHRFGYIFVRNNPKKMIVKCNIDGCKWKISAYALGKTTSILCVKKFHNEHMHSAQDNLLLKQKANSRLTSSIIIDAVRGNVEKTSNEIRQDLYKEYGLNLTYRQALRGKDRALEEIHGLPQQSYMLIPWLCEKLKETDLDTVVKWVPRQIIDLIDFLLHMDAASKGFSKGILLLASAIDANNDLFPLAYAIVGGETYDNWAWFLENVKEITHQVQLTIVSDRHNAIVGAMRAIFDGNRHAFCYRHVKENYSSEFTKINRGIRRIDGMTKEDALKLLDNIAYARLEKEFHVVMGHLIFFSPQLARWLEINEDINCWALARFPYKRWDNITSNHAESFNAWLVKERKHHICALINKHRAKLARKLYNSKIEMANWSNGVGSCVEAKLRENALRAEVMVAEHYSVNMILVKVGNNDLRVNLTLRECSCQEWQMVGILCAHACAAIKLVQGNVYSYVEECYTIRAQEKIYSSTMIPMETIDMPQLTELHYEDYEKNIFLEPPLTTRPPGQPPTKRRESQFQNKKVYYCSRCNQAGHTKNRCRNPNPM